MEIKTTTDLTNQVYLDALSIRYTVFVDEQQVPKALEVDEDEAAAIHFVLYEEDQPLATLRLLPLSPSQVKLQRMAVQQDARQKSLGKQLILFAENYANEQGYQTITLGAQQTAIPFYEKIGYQPQGEPFMDAGIPHITMHKTI